jgi:hypothetical protein
MKQQRFAKYGLAKSLAALIALLALPAAWGQVPVDENGEPVGSVQSLGTEPTTGSEDIPLLSQVDLEELVGPIALYPDDLLAIVLPAASYPLQIIDAARFLEALENDPSLEPDSEWDDSVVALTNYPEVIELLNDDIDWTWRLGEAVVSQQADVVAAIETFRDRAYAAGNLKSDSYQNISRDEGVIEITPVSEDVIYVPYYEPERVVVYQPRPAYYYYPRPYPVYYYPYSSAFAFDRGYFWGVTTAFTIGWYSNSLNVFHHSYHGHPYYGRSYRDRWWYRRPTINIYNNHYVGPSPSVTVNRYYRGDRWQRRGDRREHINERRITRNRTYPVPRRSDASVGVSVNNERSRQVTTSTTRRRQQEREPIAFRDRPRNATVAREDRAERARQTDRKAPVTSTNRRSPPATADSRRNGTRPETRTSQNRNTPVTRTTRRSPATIDNRGSGSRPETRASLDRQQRLGERRTVPTYKASKDRRANPTPKLRRSEPISVARRSEPVQQTSRNTAVSQSRRTAPATRSTRREAPATQVRRSQAAQPARRTAPARPAARQEPQRQATSSRKSAPAKEARKAPDRRSSQQRRQD